MDVWGEWNLFSCWFCIGSYSIYDFWVHFKLFYRVKYVLYDLYFFNLKSETGLMYRPVMQRDNIT